MAEPTLVSLVRDALNNAVENGYDWVKTGPVNKVITDLMDCDAELEDADPEKLAPIVEDWQLEQT